MSLKMGNIVCGRCSVSQITQFKRCIFSKNINIIRHLKLEIASNDKKIQLTQFSWTRVKFELSAKMSSSND